MVKQKNNNHGAQVQRMFSDISGTYDLLNRLMTFGQDTKWRSLAISKLNIKPNATILDIGAGTGDITNEIAKKNPQAFVVGCDFTYDMLKLGKDRYDAKNVEWVIADAHNLPFAKSSCDNVISGFLLRNVTDLKKTLSEQYRILLNKGTIVALDTTPPQKSFLKPFILLYFRVVIPFLGTIIARNPKAYQYLPQTTENFVKPEKLIDILLQVGFKKITYTPLMFKTIAIHHAEKL